MQYEIVHPGSNAMVIVQLSPGESVKAEAGTMVAKSDNVTLEGKMDSGIGQALKRSLAGGENLFFQTMKAIGGSGEVMIAPAIPGDIKILEMTEPQGYYLQGGAFLAALGEINVDTKMQKLSAGLFSGEGFFVLHCTGKGNLAVSAFGGIYEINLPAGKDYIVGNGHVVAWTGGTGYSIEKAAQGWINTFTSGQGLVCRFKGPGKVWIQTRNPQAFGSWIRRYIPAE